MRAFEELRYSKALFLFMTIECSRSVDSIVYKSMMLRQFSDHGNSKPLNNQSALFNETHDTVVYKKV